jgi:hypothetical protein
MATISSRIRYLGGLTEKGFHDTIQSEIDKLIAGQSRPLPAGTAIPTSSGGPDSILYDDQGISHVIHVAAVRGDPDRRRIAPLTDDHLIRRCVTKALLAAQTICQNTGVISPEGTPQRDLQEKEAASFAPRHLVLPLFGTGRGGLSPAYVGPLMLQAILDFFASRSYNEQYMPFTDIHLSVYSQDDIAVMSEALKNPELNPRRLQESPA